MGTVTDETRIDEGVSDLNFNDTSSILNSITDVADSGDNTDTTAASGGNRLEATGQ